MDKLIDFVWQHVQPSEDELTQFLQLAHKKHVRKDALILQPGQLATEFLFLVSGSVRTYKRLDNREVTGWISLAGNPVVEIVSYITQQPSEFYVQALENVEAYVFHQADLERLGNESSIWLAFTRRFYETLIVNMVQRVFSLLTDPAQVRYERLLEQPDYLQKVALKDLATFIGVAPNSITRLRRHVS